jgi:hypothetical protein
VLRRLSIPLLLLVLAAAFASSAAAAVPPGTPLYPDLKTLPPRDLRLDRTDVSADGSGQFHNVLRFSNTVWNGGEGRAEIRAQIDPTTKSGPAFQRVYDSSGNYVDYPAGQMYWHAAHQHYHYDNWGHYELWPKSAWDSYVASGRQIGSPQMIGSKTTSCVMDEEFIAELTGTPWPAVFPAGGCSPDSNGLIVEGLSVGWGDTYDYYRWGQWIDLAQGSLADGQYVLRSVTDPTNTVYESPNKGDTTREGDVPNEGLTPLTISAGKLVDTDPPSGTVSINNADAATTSPTVSVSVTGRDDVSGVNQFRLSNDGNTWATYSYTTTGSTPTTVNWDLTDARYGGTATPGQRYVFAQFHDASGKWSTATYKDSITWDSGPPPPTSAYATKVLSDGPVAYWRLGELSGTTASDSAGANKGTYVNGPTLGAPSLLGSDSANKATTFDGVNDYVTVNDSAGLSQAAKVSVEAWIKPGAVPAAGGWASVLTKREAYTIQFNGPRLEFTVMQGGGTRKRAQAPAGAVVAGQVYHVVGTYDGTTARLYLNGTEAANLPLTGAIGVNANALVLGSWDGSSERYTGTIDDAAVYPAALTAAQVKAHFDAGSTAPVVNPLDPPTGLSATATSNTQVDLKWTDNSTAETGFVVERDTSASFAAPTVTTTAANATTYSDTGLTPGTKYYYRVKAQGTSAQSAYSNTANATTPNPVAAPSGLTATPVSTSRIDLAWADNSANETGFTVERDATGTFANPQRFPLGPNTTSYTDLGLNPSTKYYYRVKATNATDASPYTPIVNATTKDPPLSGYAAEVAADAPVSWWRLGESSGTAAADQRGANAGTYVAGPTLGAPSLLGTDTANTAVTFDSATKSYVRVANSASLTIGSPLTLETWIKPAAVPAAGSFASVLTKPESYSLQFNGPLLEFTIIQNGTRKRLQAPSGTIVAGQTYHVVGTYDGTTRRLYVNGAQVATGALTGAATATTNALYMASWNGGTEFLKGTIDEVAVYSTALSATRVSAHYTAGH